MGWGSIALLCQDEDNSDEDIGNVFDSVGNDDDGNDDAGNTDGGNDDDQLTMVRVSESSNKLHRQGEDDCRVLLRRDRVQGLKIPGDDGVNVVDSHDHGHHHHCHLSWSAAGDCEITSAASFKALAAFCSPSLAITLMAMMILLMITRRVMRIKRGIKLEMLMTMKKMILLMLMITTLALASLVDSASAAIALCIC